MLYKSEVMQSPVANEMRDQAQVLRAQGMLPSRAAQAGDGSGAPINQQSFANPGSMKVIGQPGMALPTPSPMYVPGLGTLGPDAGGWLKGVQAAQDMQLKAAGNARADESLGLEKAKFGLAQDYYNLAQADLGIKLDDASQKRQKFDIDMNLMDGMNKAAEVGGYTGVIDYLKTANPGLAVQFHSEKLKLDDSIMKNEVMQAQLPGAKAQAMFDTYGTGAKLVAGILKLPPDQRAEGFRAAQPMLKAIDPNFPNEFNADAVTKMELMLYQGMPENMVFANSQNAAVADSQIGKLLQSREAAIAKYGLNSSEVADVDSEINAKRAQFRQANFSATKAQLDLDNSSLNQADKIMKMTDSLQGGIDKASKQYVEQMPAMANAWTLADQIAQSRAKGEKVSDTSAARQLFVYGMAVLANGTRPTNEDVQAIVLDAGWSKVANNVQAAIDGKQVPLSDEGVMQFATVLKKRIQDMQDGQLKLESQYQKQADQYKYKDSDGTERNIIQWDGIVKPSQRFGQILGDPNAAPAQGKYQDPPMSDVQYLNNHPDLNVKLKFQEVYGLKNLRKYDKSFQ